MARADERVNERLARAVQNRVESGAAVAPRLGAASSSGGRPAEAQGEQGKHSGQAETAFAGAHPAPDESESSHAPTSAVSDIGETVQLED
eukprot:11994936-Alexandrium_andersonii.AAC.1